MRFPVSFSLAAGQIRTSSSLIWGGLTALKILAEIGAATAATPPPPLGANEAILRPYADGAGPAAIFRLGRDQANKRDVFGVVDPIMWRIQFYTVDDFTADVPLAARVHPRGDCLLPPRFRVWRVHQFDNQIVLQSQPEVTPDTLHSEQQFTHRKITLSKAQDYVLSVAGKTPTPHNVPSSDKCGGTAVSFDNLPAFVPRTDSATSVTGGGETELPFVVTRRNPSPRGPAFHRAPITIPTNGAFLVSVQELETSESIARAPLRHFVVTSRMSGKDDVRAGFLTPIVTVHRRGERTAQAQVMRLNLGLSRVKAGQKFVAVTSVGEVLVIGAADHDNFRFISCSFETTAGRGRPSHCTVTTEPTASTTARSDEEDDNTAADIGAVSDGVWTTAFWYANQEYSVDATTLPCTRLKGCKIGPSNDVWTPLSEMRLHTGIYQKKGVPYAQSTSKDGRPGPNLSTVFPTAAQTKTTPVPMRRIHIDNRQFVFGDISNTDIVSSTQVSVFGIDCSAFLSTLWGFDRLDTIGFVKRATANQFLRVPSIGATTIGDAFVISLADTVNHIVMFRETRAAGPYDSSRTMLVIESSSSCGGVCWSFYDESFFGGWAIIRNSKKITEEQKNYDAVPTTYATWKEFFAR